MDRLLEATARAERDHFWFRGFRRFVTPLLRQATQGRSNVRILDCGCGTGHNLTMLRRFGRAAGIDITWTGLAYARSRGERQIARASATRLPFRDHDFDLVTAFDVLYALDDEMERDALNEMYRVLRPGGQIIINVAALKTLTGNHSVLGRELRRYQRSELRDHLTRAGFKVRRITYTNFTLLPLVAAVRFSQRVIGYRESDSDIALPPAPVNAALSAVLAIEAAALRVIDLPLGSSLLALAVKPGTATGASHAGQPRGTATGTATRDSHPGQPPGQPPGTATRDSHPGQPPGTATRASLLGDPVGCPSWMSPYLTDTLYIRSAR
jgi:SAM-dependent methyltransferase